MAAKGLGIDKESFCCSICLDLLKDPVTVPCGHSYCMVCVNTHWNEEVGKQSYSCPQCRQSFSQRPVLVKNTMLALLMDGLKKSGLPAAPVSHCPAAHGDVSCDLCCGRKVKAVKSCLQCLVSYCEEHLQPHYDVAALKKHKLVAPTENLQDNICSRHDEVMKMFCRTDQQCICYLCSVDEHKGHDTVTAATEMNEKKRELEAFREKILQRIENKEKTVATLKHMMKTTISSADEAVDYSNQGLKHLISLIEKRMSDLKEQIRSKQEAEVQRAKELQDKLRQELTELERKHNELDSLSQTEDHLQFLHKFASISKVSETSESPYTCRPFPPFSDMVTLALADLRGKIEPPTVVDKQKYNPPKREDPPAGAQVNAPSRQNTSEDRPTLPHSNMKLKPTASIPRPLQPNTLVASQPFNVLSYWELKKHACKLTWDPRSLNDKLVLSEENRCAKRMPYPQNHPNNRARFTDVPQVVSKESLNGCCYWEVLANYDQVITVAVAYKDIRRNGSSKDCSFGKNNKSWALECFSGQKSCVFWHNGDRVEIKLQWGVGRSVGVFTDYKAGILSFYHGHETEHLYTVKTTFTQPLVAGLRLDDVCSTAKICTRMFIVPSDDEY